MAKEEVPPVDPVKEEVPDVAPVDEEPPAPPPPVSEAPRMTPAMREEKARNEAWSAGLKEAEAWAKGKAAARRAEAVEEYIARGLCEEDAVQEAANLPIEMHIQREIYRRAMEQVVQYVLVDTPDDKPLKLTDKTTVTEIGDWTLLDANDIEHLRSAMDTGRCNAIIRPPGWEPKARA